ncbi:IclR family transcriptional regulator [Limobrevibacterium gyesilva]|uniref:IclR family transcriptional regulator n=1 Tax=Limobrevibacterium gyesilva TaxID=2991712 RepID=A0AA41YPH5_9PROT|nr:IclR family transcriptional regulator [Limobrevibacterium gyesilva]MCW3477309.1 IclR family transcriptional regulator [Limobrevibacterium gyesilva]
MARPPREESAAAADEAADDGPNYIIAAVDRALRLLGIVGDTPGLGLSELARLSGNTKARTFRLLQTLENAGFVQQRLPETDYWLGPRALRLSLHAAAQIDIVQLGQRVLDAIGPRCEETVQLRVRQGLESLCVCKWETQRIVRYHAEVGQASPLHAGASKVLLAYAPAAVLDVVLACPRQRYTDTTPVEAADLLAALDRIRVSGHCISCGEVAPEAFSVGVPVRDATGQVAAALLIAAPLARVAKARVPELLALAEEGAAALSRALGHG